MEYKILKERTLEEIETLTVQDIQNGWQCMGPVQYESTSGVWYREMMRMYNPNTANQTDSAGDALQSNEDISAAFSAKLSDMDKYVYDLLDINGILLYVNAGEMYTEQSGVAEKGISAARVLELLKKSQHCPIDLNEELVLSEIEKLL